MDIRVECGRGKFVAHDVLRDGVGEHEVALTCMAAQDVTATDMLENNPNYPANDLIADSLAILSAPDLFTKNGGKDGKPKVDDTNPTTGKNYTLSMYENILQRAASGALTYTEPDGIEKPIYCELAAEIGFQFGVIQATNPNAGEQPLVQYANLMADGVATAAMYACYDKKPGNFQWGENDLPEAFVGLVAGVRRGMAAVSLKIE